MAKDLSLMLAIQRIDASELGSAKEPSPPNTAIFRVCTGSADGPCVSRVRESCKLPCFAVQLQLVDVAGKYLGCFRAHEQLKLSLQPAYRLALESVLQGR